MRLVQVQDCSSEKLDAIPIKQLLDVGKTIEKVNVMGLLCHPPWDPKKTRVNTFHMAITIQGITALVNYACVVVG